MVVYVNAECLFFTGADSSPFDAALGVGFDHCWWFSRRMSELDFHYRIFNADGSEAAQCGNGARCFARFVRLKG
ncbi:hypothetical protein ACNKHL_23300 [Shigella flexneri]